MYRYLHCFVPTMGKCFAPCASCTANLLLFGLADKLYQEASVSQVFSINPFHMDSQPNDIVLREKVDDCLLFPKGTKRLSAGRQWQIVKPKVPTQNLVPDSEALNLTPSHSSSGLLDCRASQRLSSIPNHQSPVGAVPLADPGSSVARTKLAPSAEHTNQNSPTTEDDLFAALDCMPNLVSIMASKLSTPSVKKIDYRANSLSLRKVSTERALSPQETEPSSIKSVPVHEVHIKPASSFRETEPRKIMNISADSQLQVWSKKKNISMNIATEVWPVHRQQSEVIAPRNGTRPCLIVNLSAYAPQLDDPESHHIDASITVTQDEELERVNRLFE
ncbi:hypothetical protein FBUS_10414 [Fasciolopsis buskii]|uniref:Uncharacterized protein n=1 Tax=Fasciolopsis buskii TaxID=27845 RepID=A0A8E0RRT2_9TREM|nr:hypothetical protein FBUS_10414 [Fasciolopsis buski]